MDRRLQTSVFLQLLHQQHQQKQQKQQRRQGRQWQRQQWRAGRRAQPRDDIDPAPSAELMQQLIELWEQHKVACASLTVGSGELRQPSVTDAAQHQAA
jgi:hypothetical protein